MYGILVSKWVEETHIIFPISYSRFILHSGNFLDPEEEHTAWIESTCALSVSKISWMLRSADQTCFRWCTKPFFTGPLASSSLTFRFTAYHCHPPPKKKLVNNIRQHTSIYGLCQVPCPCKRPSWSHMLWLKSNPAIFHLHLSHPFEVPFSIATESPSLVG